MNHRQRGPIRRLIRRQSASDRIDAERKKTVEFGMEALQAEDVFVEEIPVKGFEVAHIEDDAVTLRNGALVHRIRADDLEEFITAPASIQQAFEKFGRNSDIARSRQFCPPG